MTDRDLPAVAGGPVPRLFLAEHVIGSLQTGDDGVKSEPGDDKIQHDVPPFDVALGFCHIISGGSRVFPAQMQKNSRSGSFRTGIFLSGTRSGCTHPHCEDTSQLFGEPQIRPKRILTIPAARHLGRNRCTAPHCEGSSQLRGNGVHLSESCKYPHCEGSSQLATVMNVSAWL